MRSALSNFSSILDWFIFSDSKSKFESIAQKIENFRRPFPALNIECPREFKGVMINSEAK